jgi:hypothetical protein
LRNSSNNKSPVWVNILLWRAPMRWTDPSIKNLKGDPITVIDPVTKIETITGTGTVGKLLFNFLQKKPNRYLAVFFYL